VNSTARELFSRIEASATDDGNERQPLLETRLWQGAVALDIIRRPKATPIHELERYMRCKDCSEVRGYALQAEPSGCVAHEEDIGERSAVSVVAGER